MYLVTNGAGKSTTIKLLLNILSKDRGVIEIFGKDYNTLTMADKEDIGVVLDECCFAETLSAKNINIILKKIYMRWNEKKFFDMLKSLAIPSNRLLKKYSKGMKMKLSIIISLCHEAKLLILDEATSGLDPIVRDEILDILLEFVQNEECSVLISSHITSDLEKICDFITFIDNGEIVFSLPKDEIFEKYGILRCKNSDLAVIDPRAIVGYRKNSFATDALVLREYMPDTFIIDKASIEDVMLYYIKEAKG